MKNFETTTHHSIVGKWEWCSFERDQNTICSPSGRPPHWHLSKNCPESGIIYDFRDNGILVIDECGRRTLTSEYRFDPATMLLTTNTLMRSTDGTEEIMIDNIYRVEFLSPDRMLHYDIGDLPRPTARPVHRLGFKRMGNGKLKMGIR